MFSEEILATGREEAPELNGYYLYCPEIEQHEDGRWRIIGFAEREFHSYDEEKEEEEQNKKKINYTDCDPPF